MQLQNRHQVCVGGLQIKMIFENKLLKTHRLHIIPGIFFLICCSFFAVAQPIVKATVDKTSIKIGEPITVKLEAIWPGNPLAHGFIVPDSIAHFDIWEKQNQEVVKDGLQQNIIVTSYDSGRFTIPAFKLDLQKTNAADPDYYTDSISINVTKVNVDTLKEYHDIKDIIEVPPIPQWPYILAIAIGTIIAITAVYFLLKKLGVLRKEKPVFVPKGSPYQVAMNALSLLEENGSQRSPRQFFTELTDVYRTYLKDAHNWRSLQQTGDELILQAKPLLSQELFFAFANTIRLGDAAKFAKYAPPKETWMDAIQPLRHTIDVLEKQQAEKRYQPPANNAR